MRDMVGGDNNRNIFMFFCASQDGLHHQGNVGTVSYTNGDKQSYITVCHSTRVKNAALFTTRG